MPVRPVLNRFDNLTIGVSDKQCRDMRVLRRLKFAAGIAHGCCARAAASWSGRLELGNTALISLAADSNIIVSQE
jgi:hypothetical protein